MDKNQSGAKHLYRTEGADSFRAAWKAAIALAAERKRAARAAAPPRPVEVPGIERRRKPSSAHDGPLPGQVLNEFGEWEDEASLQQRAEEARDSISNKLLRIRRLYLKEISGSAGKRAAFEILTELPIERLFEEEQAKVDAIRAPLEAAAERDLWPRHLYWSL